MSRVNLNMRNVDVSLFQTVKSFISEGIITNSTGDCAPVAQQRSHVSEISRRAAKLLLSSWQDVPEQLT
jgi:hypothetical protein